MLTLDQSLEKFLKEASPLGAEKVGITKSLNRVLSEDIFSDVDMPPFDKSTMDGYACRTEDLTDALTVVETIPAGSFPKVKIEKGQCSKIMTGAPVPEGANCVIMIEHTDTLAGNKIKFLKEKTNPNICYLGEDVSKGQKVLQKGTRLKPRHIPTLASVGCSEVPVYKLPKVGVLTTGSELVEPDEKPEKAKIRNSNAYQLIASLYDIGLKSTYYGIVKDDKESIELELKKAFYENDTVLLTGGVSMGDFDLIPDIIKKMGMEIHFSKLAIKPGKPILFASKENKLCFGLSGNPVSSFFQFELVCKNAIFSQMGYFFKPKLVEFELGNDIKRKNADRLGFYPVKYKNNKVVEPVEFHGSAHIHSLSEAFGIVDLLPGKLEIKKGERVNVRPI